MNRGTNSPESTDFPPSPRGPPDLGISAGSPPVLRDPPHPPRPTRATGSRGRGYGPVRSIGPADLPYRIAGRRSPGTQTNVPQPDVPSPEFPAGRPWRESAGATSEGFGSSATGGGAKPWGRARSPLTGR